jgi:hypothetical protein
MRRWGAAFAFIALLLATSASGSTQRDELIRPGVGIGKVRLGMTLAQVRAAWGAPQAVAIRTRKRGERIVELQYEFAAYVATLSGLRGHERVIAVGTTLARERLPQGVGVGSPERRLQRVFRGELHCEILPVEPGTAVFFASARRRCTLGDRHGRHTVFTSGLHLRYPWDARPVADWARLARVKEVVVRASGTPGARDSQS